jgi:large subunit ribosomal protein L29
MSKRVEFLNEIRQKSVKELVKLRKELKKELFELKMKNNIGALKQTHLIKETRKKIAQINTVLTEKIYKLYPGQVSKQRKKI